jgi:hypothetical protein
VQNPPVTRNSNLNVHTKAFEKILDSNENLVSIDWLNRAVEASKIVCKEKGDKQIAKKGILIWPILEDIRSRGIKI